MCSIIASFDKDTVKRLAKLNEYRGQHSHSVFVFDRFTREVLHSHRAFGVLDIDSLQIPEGYIVCHQQAPTTDNKDVDSIHPAQYKEQLLYHNGIVKDIEVKRLGEKLQQTDTTWDTMLILHQLYNTQLPDNIDGTFSCVWYDGEQLSVFRNEISPLFIDHHALIDKRDIILSSTKFDDSTLLEPNKMFQIDLTHFAIHPGKEFDTQENPYFFG